MSKIQFQGWLDSRYKDEIAAGEHVKFSDMYDVAMHYMRSGKDNA